MTVASLIGGVDGFCSKNSGRGNFKGRFVNGFSVKPKGCIEVESPNKAIDSGLCIVYVKKSPEGWGGVFFGN
jgi:hypothetical protein